MRPLLLAGLLAVALPSASIAGSPFADSETRLRDAYAHYRVSLFASNSGKQEETARAIADFGGAWDGLAADWAAAPPPQYMDDTALSGTLTAVRDAIAEASAQTGDGKLGAAHETLERVRDEIGALHLRNGLYTFADRMNAYHARMEDVLAADLASRPDGGLAYLAEEAAVLEYLADDIAAHPAPEAGAEGYADLLGAMRDSVAALAGAARAGDLAAAKAALGKLKAPYSRFFLRFG